MDFGFHSVIFIFIFYLLRLPFYLSLTHSVVSSVFIHFRSLQPTHFSQQQKQQKWRRRKKSAFEWWNRYAKQNKNDEINNGAIAVASLHSKIDRQLFLVCSISFQIRLAMKLYSIDLSFSFSHLLAIAISIVYPLLSSRWTESSHIFFSYLFLMALWMWWRKNPIRKSPLQFDTYRLADWCQHQYPHEICNSYLAVALNIWTQLLSFFFVWSEWIQFSVWK